MTLEEMIKAIQEQAKHFDTQIYPDEAEVIIAALLAGQAMSLDLQTIAKESSEEWGEPLVDHEYFSAKSWDAVVGKSK